MKCPKCQFDNPDDTLFCGKCGTEFDATAGPTRIFETSTATLISGNAFAGRYEIIEELGKSGIGVVYKDRR